MPDTSPPQQGLFSGVFGFFARSIVPAGVAGSASARNVAAADGQKPATALAAAAQPASSAPSIPTSDTPDTQRIPSHSQAPEPHPSAPHPPPARKPSNSQLRPLVLESTRVTQPRPPDGPTAARGSAISGRGVKRRVQSKRPPPKMPGTFRSPSPLPAPEPLLQPSGPCASSAALDQATDDLPERAAKRRRLSLEPPDAPPHAGPSDPTLRTFLEVVPEIVVREPSSRPTDALSRRPTISSQPAHLPKSSSESALHADPTDEKIRKLELEIEILKKQLARTGVPPPAPPPPMTTAASTRVAPSWLPRILPTPAYQGVGTSSLGPQQGQSSNRYLAEARARLKRTPPKAPRPTSIRPPLPTAKAGPAVDMDVFLNELKTVKLRKVGVGVDMADARGMLGVKRRREDDVRETLQAAIQRRFASPSSSTATHRPFAEQDPDALSIPDPDLPALSPDVSLGSTDPDGAEPSTPGGEDREVVALIAAHRAVAVGAAAQAVAAKRKRGVGEEEVVAEPKGGKKRRTVAVGGERKGLDARLASSPLPPDELSTAKRKPRSAARGSGGRAPAAKTKGKGKQRAPSVDPSEEAHDEDDDEDDLTLSYSPPAQRRVLPLPLPRPTPRALDEELRLARLRAEEAEKRARYEYDDDVDGAERGGMESGVFVGVGRREKGAAFVRGGREVEVREMERDGPRGFLGSPGTWAGRVG